RLVTYRQPHRRIKLWYAPSGDPDEGMNDVLISIHGESPLRLKPREVVAFLDLLPAMRACSGAKPTGDPPSLREFDKDVAHIWNVPKASRARRIAAGQELRKIIKGFRLALPVCAVLFLLTTGAWCLNRWVVQPGHVGRWILSVFVLSVGLP